jgi:ribose 5-phosphate isomerase A
MLPHMTIEACKKAAGEKAASFIKDGMIVGLGTGSTAFYFIEKLIQRCREGLKIQVVASSQRSLDQASKGKLPLIDINTIKTLDISVDGADEIDPNKQIIKGAGGALLREKIVACMSKEMVVIVDESKLVDKLGRRPVPVEVFPFGHTSTLHKLKLLGYVGNLRRNPDRSFYTTDNQNLLYDVQIDLSRTNPSVDHQQMISVPGVVDTGFFLDIAGRVVIGFLDGQVVVQ